MYKVMTFMNLKIQLQFICNLICTKNKIARSYTKKLYFFIKYKIIIY